MTRGALDEARALIAQANRTVVLTGAGISTASGIADFRGPQGVWTKDPHAEMLSNFETWITNSDVRQRAWASRVARRHDRIEPNDAHRALAEFERSEKLELLVTQNIDGLHQRAGSNPHLVVEIHGSALDSLCLVCGHREPIEKTLDRVEAGELDPLCERIVKSAICHGMLKSATVSFGQSLVAADLARSESAARQCDLFLAVGSTLAVYPVAALVPLAKDHGAHVIIVNGAATSLDYLADVLVDGDINSQLPGMLLS